MPGSRIAVMGAGLVGRVIIEDLLASGYEVVVLDARQAALDALGSHARLQTRCADLTRPDAVAAAARQADLVVGAVPGALGHVLLEGVLASERPLVDISFAPDYPPHLAAAARTAAVPLVIDCGLAPGLSNLLAGRECHALDEVESVVILVGGLPLARESPYEFRFLFSPDDVIEEYVRPCRMREHGRAVTIPALSGVEQVEFAAVGTLEAFNTDGLRTLLETLPAHTLKEKTLRYPGHAEKMRLLRDTGLFATEPEKFGDVEIAPRLVTTRVLERLLRRAAGDDDITVLRVQVEGIRGGQARHTTWELVDHSDAGRGHTSMARTTAFPCAAVARLVASGRWTRPGLHAPEILGTDPGATTAILDDLEERGVRPTRTGQ